MLFSAGIGRDTLSHAQALQRFPNESPDLKSL